MTFVQRFGLLQVGRHIHPDLPPTPMKEAAPSIPGSTLRTFVHISRVSTSDLSLPSCIELTAQDATFRPTR